MFDRCLVYIFGSLRVLGLWVSLWKLDLGFVFECLYWILSQGLNEFCGSIMFEGLIFLGIFVFVLCVFFDRESRQWQGFDLRVL